MASVSWKVTPETEAAVAAQCVPDQAWGRSLYSAQEISWALKREVAESAKSSHAGSESGRFKRGKKNANNKLLSRKEQAKLSGRRTSMTRSKTTRKDAVRMGDSEQQSSSETNDRDSNIEDEESLLDAVGFEDWESEWAESDLAPIALAAAFPWASSPSSHVTTELERPADDLENKLFTFYLKKFDDLPNDIILSLFSYLDFSMFSRIYLVSKRWLELSGNHPLRSEYFMDNAITLAESTLTHQYNIEPAIYKKALAIDAKLSLVTSHLRSTRWQGSTPSFRRALLRAAAGHTPSSFDLALRVSMSSIPVILSNTPPLSHKEKEKEKDKKNAAQSPKVEVTDKLRLIPNNLSKEPIRRSETVAARPLSAARTNNGSDDAESEGGTYMSVDEMLAVLTAHDFSYNKKEIVSEEVFMAMVPSFSSYVVIILKLIEKFYIEIPPEYSAEKQRMEEYTNLYITPVRRRIIQLFRLFIKSHWQEFGSEERVLLKSFVLVIEKAYSGFLISQIKSTISTTDTLRARISAVQSSMNAGPLSKDKYCDPFATPSIDLAKTFARIDFDLFKNIRPVELQRQMWTKRPERAPGVRIMIDRFNVVTRWIVTHLLAADRIKSRVKRYVKFVEVAEKLLEVHDYHTLMAVLAALNEGPVYRLTHTLAEVPEKTKESFKAMHELMEATKSYARYRESLWSSPGFAVPYLGVHLRDLIYFDDSMKNSKGQINIKAINGISALITQFTELQNAPFTYEITSRTLPETLSMDELMEISKKLEPKGATREEIL